MTTNVLEHCERILKERDIPPALLDAIARAKPILGRELAPRETKVMTLFCEGLGRKEIGAQLHISEATVIRHIRNVRDKLGARNQTHAAVLFARLTP